MFVTFWGFGRHRFWHRCVRNNRRPRPDELIGFGAIYVTKPLMPFWFCDIDGPKPYEFIRSRARIISHIPVCWHDSFRGYFLLRHPARGGSLGNPDWVRTYATQQCFRAGYRVSGPDSGQILIRKALNSALLPAFGRPGRF